MADQRSIAGPEFMEIFSRFSRLHWRPGSNVGLKHSEVLALYWIRRTVGSEAPGIRVSEIGNMLGVAPPTVTGLINGLVDNGFLERSADRTDRRAVRIKLTDKGEDAISKALDAFHSFFDGLANYLGEEESHEFVRLLARVFAYFDLVKDQVQDSLR